MGTLPLASSQRVSQIQFHGSQPFLAIQSNDHSVEIFRLRSAEEMKKRIQRRLRRAEEKGRPEAIEGVAEPSTSELLDMIAPYVVIRASGRIRSLFFGPNVSSTKSAKSIPVGCALDKLAPFI